MADFGANPGNLRMFVRRPHRAKGVASSLHAHGARADGGHAATGKRQDRPALVVALHGCFQTPETYDHGSGWSDLAARCGFALLMPGQRPANNPNRCFNWYTPEHSARDTGEAGSIKRMIDYMVEGYGIDRKRIFVVGLSAGGAMAANLLAIYPDIFAAGATIAGLPFGTAGTLPEAMQGMAQGRSRSPLEWGNCVRAASSHDGPWPRLSVWHGAADTVVHLENAASLIEQWRGLHGITAEAHEVSVGDHRRRVWRDAGGRELIEAYDVAGMAHGVPLSSDCQPSACGSIGGFHLAAGICSTHRIAQFWGLAANIEPADAAAGC